MPQIIFYLFYPLISGISFYLHSGFSKESQPNGFLVWLIADTNWSHQRYLRKTEFIFLNYIQFAVLPLY